MANKNSTAASALQTAIELETAAFYRLIDLLNEEQRALLGARPDGLKEVVARKNRELDALAGYGRDRLDAMDALGLPRNPDRAEMRMARHPLGAAYRQLRELARSSSALNKLNGELARQKLQFVSARLDVLRGAAQRAGLYDATGRSGDSGSSGRVIAAA
jgi:flagellar biosynthesis/type III secretory pathway chaperone